MNYRLLSSIMGLHLAASGVALLFFSCLSFLFFASEQQAWNFLLSALVSFTLAALLKMPSVHFLDKQITFREIFAVAFGSYFFIAFVGALPFYAGIQNISFMDSFFESLSALTTTGISVLGEEGSTASVLLLWRAFEKWLGGLGVIVFFLGMLPYMGIVPARLLKEDAEPGGGDFSSRLVSSLVRFISIYIFFTLLMLLVLLFSKMDFWLALRISFATISSGGLSHQEFSRQIDQQGASLLWITGIFMYLTSISYLLHLSALRRKFLNYVKHSEFIYFNIILLGATLLIAWQLGIKQTGLGFGEIFLKSLFSVLSAISTTGHAWQLFDNYPIFVRMILLFLALLGPMASGMGGGIKVIRMMALLKEGVIEVIKTVHPNKTMSPRFGDVYIPRHILERINSYTVIYFFLVSLSFAGLAAANLSFEDSFVLAVSSFTTGGSLFLSSHLQPHNLQNLSAYVKFVLLFSMLLGRLEIYPVLSLLQPRIWKK